MLNSLSVDSGAPGDRVPLRADAQQKSPGAGPVIVLETSKGTIEFETYPRRRRRPSRGSWSS